MTDLANSSNSGKPALSTSMPDPSLSTLIQEVRKQYASWQTSVAKLPHLEQVKLQRQQIRTDLYYLLRYVMGRADIEHPWMLARIREVQNAPDGHLDLWARDHRKSTCITYALTIQDILASHGDDPLQKWNGMEPTFGIFSHTRGIASEFVRQIKQELQANTVLLGLFPDVLYANAERDAPRWSVQNGLTVKRKSNPKEATVEGWGLVDGQPTGKHFNVLIYDDVVTKESISTPEMIKKTTESWELSQNLGDRNPRIRGIGTRYHFADTWRAIMDREALIPRLHPATVDGTQAGEPVYLTKAEIATKRRNMGPYMFCFPYESPVLMADGTQRQIGEIVVGDVIVGYETGKGFGSKGRMRKSVVRAVGSRLSEVMEVTFESGEIVRCTPDHKFFTGRAGSDAHRIYNKLGLDYHDLKTVQRVYRPSRLENFDREAAAYLRGIVDGEGHIRKKDGAVTITQSPEHNPEVCERIEECLRTLGVKWKSYDRAASKASGRNAKAGRMYVLALKRCDKIWLLNVIRPAKRKNLEANVLTSMKCKADKLASIRSLGQRPVYNIETETGNYIAWGVMAKNSAQMLLNPIADSRQTFLREWFEHRFEYGQLDHSSMNRVLLCDPASGKKKSDWTTMAVIGKGTDGNVYLLDFIRDRLTLKERGSEYMRLHRKWKPQQSAYEEYALQADIEYIKILQQQKTHNFEIIALGGKLSKPDRINRLIPVCADGHFWMPEALMRTTHEHKVEEQIIMLIEQEFLAWPVPVHDDGMDVISRYFDVPDFEFPEAVEPEHVDDRYNRKRGRSGTWMSR